MKVIVIGNTLYRIKNKIYSIIIKEYDKNYILNNCDADKILIETIILNASKSEDIDSFLISI